MTFSFQPQRYKIWQALEVFVLSSNQFISLDLSRVVSKNYSNLVIASKCSADVEKISMGLERLSAVFGNLCLLLILSML